MRRVVLELARRHVAEAQRLRDDATVFIASGMALYGMVSVGDIRWAASLVASAVRHDRAADALIAGGYGVV